VKVIIDVDDDEWTDFRTFCGKHDIKYRIVYDCEYEVLVSINSKWILSWVSYIMLGEDILSCVY